MVEGHQTHRVAHAHRKTLQGRRFEATSPNGRFTEGAAAINGQLLHRIECHGKNLFYFFGDPADPVVLHFHFGMSGKFLNFSLPAPEPTPTTRLQLINRDANIGAHLSAMTVQHGDAAFYQQKAASLGQDPLREDANADAAWAKVSASKKSIGLLLMDQSVVAGVGNIYRAEILFKAGVHPEQPGNTLSREQFDAVWRHTVLLLQRGFQVGSILTVDPDEAKRLGKPWTRRYIYNQSRCGRCGSSIRSWDIATRTAYACETCQPLALPTAATLAPARAKALAAAVQTQEFVSHCAPDGPGEAPPSRMTVAALKAALGTLGYSTRGKKAELAARLEAALAAAAAGVEPAAAAAAATAVVETAGASDSVEEVEEVAVESDSALLATPAPRTPATRHSAAAVALTTAAAATGVAEAAAATPAVGASARGPRRGRRRVDQPAAVAPVVRRGTKRGRAAQDVAGAVEIVDLVAEQADPGEAPVYPEVYAWDQSAPAAEAATPATARTSARPKREDAVVTPGTQPVLRRGRVASAKEAAREKAAAGEKRSVEHVALEEAQ